MAFEKEAPRIVITDWMMPLVDGLELCRMIRAQRKIHYTYIIILTALGGKSSYLEGMDSGADDFVTKPFDIDMLKSRLRVAERIVNLQTQVNQMEGLLPICAYCKRIRDSEGLWHPVETYVEGKSDTSFSHSVCPECGRSSEEPGPETNGKV